MKRVLRYALLILVLATVYKMISFIAKAQTPPTTPPTTHSTILTFTGGATGDVYKSAGLPCQSAVSFTKVATAVAGTYTDPNLGPGETDCYWVLLSNNEPTNLVEVTTPMAATVKVIPSLQTDLNAISQ